ncbi:hypothetical protein [Nocardia seriolae]|uniref:TetR family transcriptional regulator n=1 Tax=Nocardia seriolae TaxID=37332 RepID=A0ABC9Z448_9NOCA|nr:hypothetical protein [Nocardia seriolae]GAP32569.1 hypothetical protein NSK11_contig00165-0017 [Nocardia seriolae]
MLEALDSGLRVCRFGLLLRSFRLQGFAAWKRELNPDTPVSAELEQQLRTVAELYIRIAMSLLLTPRTAIALDGTEQARTFARRYLAPMLTAENRTPQDN